MVMIVAMVIVVVTVLRAGATLVRMVVGSQRLWGGSIDETENIVR